MIKIFCQIIIGFGFLVHMYMAGYDTRIYGGRFVDYGEFPMLVEIYFHTIHICGGSLITTRTVISAAHCFATCNKVCEESRHILVGDIKRTRTTKSPQSRQIFQLKSVIMHAEYNPATLFNDILLIELSGKVRQSINVSPVALAREPPIVGKRCSVAGWGMTDLDSTNKSSEFLMATEVQVTDDFYCIEKLKHYVPQTMICAGDLSGKNDSCRGDSGGPLLCDSGVLSGIVSFGVHCALPTYSAAYTDVSEYRDWINIHLAQLNHDDTRAVEVIVQSAASIVSDTETMSMVLILLYAVSDSRLR